MDAVPTTVAGYGTRKELDHGLDPDDPGGCWFLPSILILLMLVLASLGIVAQAATVHETHLTGIHGLGADVPSVLGLFVSPRPPARESMRPARRMPGLLGVTA